MSNAILGFIIVTCGIAFVLVLYGDAAGSNASTPRNLRAATGVILLLLVIGPQWLPAIGIDPQAAVNGSFAIAFGIVILISLADRLRP